MFPHQDFPYVDSNSALIHSVNQLNMEISQQGEINFDAVRKMKKTCKVLMDWNDWTSHSIENGEYTSDILGLIQDGRDIFGIDIPIARSEAAIRNGDHRRTIQHKGATYTIRHCNNLHATLGSAGPLKQELPSMRIR